ncbi:hypothetical protein HK096_004282 [Nowakowskiella sp. JEL0078]|nr:hypothetical protein HK096_004282 [Nowakowskiella sp. JEL0078]
MPEHMETPACSTASGVPVVLSTLEKSDSAKFLSVENPQSPLNTTPLTVPEPQTPTQDAITTVTDKSQISLLSDAIPPSDADDEHSDSESELLNTSQTSVQLDVAVAADNNDVDGEEEEEEDDSDYTYEEDSNDVEEVTEEEYEEDDDEYDEDDGESVELSVEKPKTVLEEIWESIFTPGVNGTVQTVFNVIFGFLFITLGLMLFLTGGNWHVVFLLFIAFGLFASVQWFLYEYKLMESSKIELGQPSTEIEIEVQMDTLENIISKKNI